MLTYEENRRYKCTCDYCNTMKMEFMDVSYDNAKEYAESKGFTLLYTGYSMRLTAVCDRCKSNILELYDRLKKEGQGVVEDEF